MFHLPSLDGINRTVLLCANRTSFCGDTDQKTPDQKNQKTRLKSTDYSDILYRMTNSGRLLAFSLLFSAALSWAQTGTGNIQGTVKDASGAVIPAAKVALVQTATNETATTLTNGVGFFLFPALRVGPYEITVEMRGMASWQGTVRQRLDLGPVDPVFDTNSARAATGNSASCGNCFSYPAIACSAASYTRWVIA